MNQKTHLDAIKDRVQRATKGLDAAIKLADDPSKLADFELAIYDLSVYLHIAGDLTTELTRNHHNGDPLPNIEPLKQVA